LVHGASNTANPLSSFKEKSRHQYQYSSDQDKRTNQVNEHCDIDIGNANNKEEETKSNNQMHQQSTRIFRRIPKKKQYLPIAGLKQPRLRPVRVAGQSSLRPK